MNNYSKIYWLTRLDNIQEFLIALFMTCFMVYTVYHICKFISCTDEEDHKNFNEKFSKYRNMSFWIGLFVSIFLVFMPTKNDMILICAGGKTMDYVQNDTSLAKIPYQTTTIISEYLDKSIKELKNKNK